MGLLGEDEDPGEVMLICVQLLVRLSSLGVLSTVILGILPSIDLDLTEIPTGDGERDLRLPEKLVPLVVLVSVGLCIKLTFWKLEKVSKLNDLTDLAEAVEAEDTEETPDANEWLEEDDDKRVRE